jgi:hypothetical protein
LKFLFFLFNFFSHDQIVSRRSWKLIFFFFFTLLFPVGLFEIRSYRHIRLADKRVHRVGDLSPSASPKKVNQFHRIVGTSLAVNKSRFDLHLFKRKSLKSKILVGDFTSL